MKFSIPKMKCGGCADNITVALRKLDATAPIEIDLDRKEVEFGGNVPQDTVLSALAEAGYPASNAR
ncbi:copper chaperone [Ochrobactrum daejeonense]|uniref:Copper chaperone n=1 Tax=Brucella daejeonensis TaxID=659015 RepID=A0A7W9AWW1_9HYPH|nr:heavy-metal-associated domain-containing protein [Brucella daejeonensis]MBB5701916.1 copper chaperone [Brucella daejeonensis]